MTAFDREMAQDVEALAMLSALADDNAVLHIALDAAVAENERLKDRLATLDHDFGALVYEHQREVAALKQERDTYESAATKALAERDALGAELEQCRVQLAGCGVAAMGGTKDPAKQGDYGWSPSYQDVLNLRAELDAARPLVEAAKR